MLFCLLLKGIMVFPPLARFKASSSPNHPLAYSLKNKIFVNLRTLQNLLKIHFYGMEHIITI